MPGPPRRFTEEEKKERRKGYYKTYYAQSIRIGCVVDEWRALRESLSLNYDSQLAETLINSFKNGDVSTSNIKDNDYDSSSTWSAASSPLAQERSNVLGNKFSKKKKPPIYMRNIGTQTRHQGMFEKANQTVLSQEDINAVCGAYSEALAETSEGEEEKENSVVNNKRWRCLKSIMGCSLDIEVANVLMDWFVNTSPLMKMSDETITAAQVHAAERAVRNANHLTEPYLLTMRVTRDQEMAIETLCNIKGWTFDPNRPVDVVNMEQYTWEPVPPLGPPFKYETPKSGQGTSHKPAEPVQKFQTYTMADTQTVDKPVPNPPTMVTVHPDGSTTIVPQKSLLESQSMFTIPQQQAQVFFMPMSQQILTPEQQQSGITMLYKPQTFSTGTVNTNKKNELQQAGVNPPPPPNIKYFKVATNKPVMNCTTTSKNLPELNLIMNRQTDPPAPVLVTPIVSEPSVTVKPPLSPVPATSIEPGQFLVTVKKEVEDMDMA